MTATLTVDGFSGGHEKHWFEHTKDAKSQAGRLIHDKAIKAVEVKFIGAQGDGFEKIVFKMVKDEGGHVIEKLIQ